MWKTHFINANPAPSCKREQAREVYWGGFTMSDMEERGRRASPRINEALPYLDKEQTVAIANAIAGAAMTNPMVAQMNEGGEHGGADIQNKNSRL